MIQDAQEKVRIVREKPKIDQSRQKSYYDRHHREESFNLDEKAYLRVTPLKGTHLFGIKGKLAPRYIGPFASSLNVEKLPTNWNYPLTSPKFMMSSTSLNSGVASRTPS